MIQKNNFSVKILKEFTEALNFIQSSIADSAVKNDPYHQEWETEVFTTYQSLEIFRASQDKTKMLIINNQNDITQSIEDLKEEEFNQLFECVYHYIDSLEDSFQESPTLQYFQKNLEKCLKDNPKIFMSFQDGPISESEKEQLKTIIATYEIFVKDKKTEENLEKFCTEEKIKPLNIIYPLERTPHNFEHLLKTKVLKDAETPKRTHGGWYIYKSLAGIYFNFPEPRFSMDPEIKTIEDVATLLLNYQKNSPETPATTKIKQSLEDIQKNAFILDYIVSVKKNTLPISDIKNLNSYIQSRFYPKIEKQIIAIHDQNLEISIKIL